MPSGGYRKNAGRPKGIGPFGEATKPMRVPLARFDEVKEFLKNGAVNNVREQRHSNPGCCYQYYSHRQLTIGIIKMKKTINTPAPRRESVLDFASWFNDNLLSTAIVAEEMEAKQAA